MKCEIAQQNVVLAVYGELEDEYSGALERHLTECEACREELASMQLLDAYLATLPMVEPSPNLLAQSRVQLDEELDMMPPHGFFTRLRVNYYNWLGHIQGAPALTTLLVGVGFLVGNWTHRYQVAHAPVEPSGVVASHPFDGSVANVTGITQLPGSGLVQVKYNRVTPETLEASLDSKEVRDLLLKGMDQGTDQNIREVSVNLLADECRAGHGCAAQADGKGLRNVLLASLVNDHNAGVRLKALEGLQRYVGEDQNVRDAILNALSHDASAAVRTKAIDMLLPVQSDSSVRYALRTASRQDDNPYIRNVSTQALQGGPDLQ